MPVIIIKDTYIELDKKQLQATLNGRHLNVVFYQKYTTNGYYKKLTNKISGLLHFRDTGEEIHPVKWTDEIENEILELKKNVIRQPTYFKLTWIAYSLIVIFIALAAFIYYQKLNYDNAQNFRKVQKKFQEQYYKNPEKGAYLITYLPNGQSAAYYVEEVSGDKMLVSECYFSIDKTNIYSGEIPPGLFNPKVQKYISKSALMKLHEFTEIDTPKSIDRIGVFYITKENLK